MKTTVCSVGDIIFIDDLPKEYVHFGCRMISGKNIMHRMV